MILKTDCLDKYVKTSSLLVLRSLGFATLWAVDDPGLPSWQKSSAITGDMAECGGWWDQQNVGLNMEILFRISYALLRHF